MGSKEMINEVVGERDTTLTLGNRGKSPVDPCWQKADRKAKKVNFLVTQPNKDFNAKATMSTIDDLSNEIQNLQTKLDQISLNIVSQREIEREHFELTDSTARSQGWMSFIKFIAVLGICGAQVYFTTSFFNNKGG